MERLSLYSDRAQETGTGVISVSQSIVAQVICLHQAML